MDRRLHAKDRSEEHAGWRQVIIDVAKSCFAQKGFRRSGTAEICAGAGMTPDLHAALLADICRTQPGDR
ncbi:helix-turn-helix transcriptional regulator [Aquamicrobium sp. LC103]|nr:helix-turn-helix transcriptional regulator [Aquamicrobium sp. LC103]